MKRLIVTAGIAASLLVIVIPAQKSLAGDRAAAAKNRRAQVEEKAADRKETQKNLKKKVKGAQEARETKREEIQNKVQEGRDTVVENREERQSLRIQHGINKGYLTTEEISQLEAQQASIAQLENSFTTDGKLTMNEFKQLQQALNEASVSIWTEKHDTDGNQMPVYRLDKNVGVNTTLTARLADPNLGRTEAQALLKDFRRMIELKKSLSGDLADAERAKQQTEYDDLLNRYFEVR